MDKLEEFAPKFVEKTAGSTVVRSRPGGFAHGNTGWSARSSSGSRFRSLLNLEPEDFDRAVSLLQPQKIQERLAQLRREIESGSPRPEIELTLDPLGPNHALTQTVCRQRRDGNGSAADFARFHDARFSDGDEPTKHQRLRLSEADETGECVSRDLRLEGWDGGKLEVLITGRSAYVAEISLSMRHDIVATVLSSIALVGAVFLSAFGGGSRCLGWALHLLLCCLIGLAAGLLDFSSPQHGDGRLLRDSGRPRR